MDGVTAGSPTPTPAALDLDEAAVGMNGEPLPALHGSPARLVVPGLHGYVSATTWFVEYRADFLRWRQRPRRHGVLLAVSYVVRRPRRELSPAVIAPASTAFTWRTATPKQFPRVLPALCDPSATHPVDTGREGG